MKQTLSLLMLVVLMLSGCVATVPVKGIVDDESVNRL
jgi:PBP1b-binding outer membrane lipoprotein LpoB